jgi:hypothetical protein
MDENIDPFVGWLLEHGQDFPQFSSELIDIAANDVKEGYQKARQDIFSRSEIGGAEKMGMDEILEQMQKLGIDNERGSYLVRRIDAIRKAGTSGDEHFTMSV